MFNIKTDFARNVLTLMTGTSIALVIPTAITPILTRLYTPEDFGLFGIVVALSAILSIISTMKFDVAIIHPKDNYDADQLFFVSILLSILFTILLYIVIYGFYDILESYIKDKELSFLLYMYPLLILIMSVNNTFNLWLNRNKKYKQMSVNKILHSSSIALVSLLLGYLSFNSFGLILGFISGHLFVFIVVLVKYYSVLNPPSFLIMRRLFFAYKNYPIVALPISLANTMAMQMPIILINKIFIASSSGYYYLVEKVLAAPVVIIGNSIGSIFRQKAQEDKHKYGNYNSIYKTTFKKLFFMGLPIFTIVSIYGREIFIFAFGSNWVEAGLYAQILAPMFLLKFSVAPLLPSIYISNKLKEALQGQVIYTIMIVLSLYLGYYNQDIIVSIICISLSGIIFYLTFLYLSYGYSKEVIN
jgi:O-antigen/teichoic acid export membrane protein